MKHEKRMQFTQLVNHGHREPLHVITLTPMAVDDQHQPLRTEPNANIVRQVVRKTHSRGSQFETVPSLHLARFKQQPIPFWVIDTVRYRRPVLVEQMKEPVAIH
jgi:hypothetical protein